MLLYSSLLENLADNGIQKNRHHYAKKGKSPPAAYQLRLGLSPVAAQVFFDILETRSSLAKRLQNG